MRWLSTFRVGGQRIGKLAHNGGNMASKANHRNNQQRTNLTWLLCYITC